MFFQNFPSPMLQATCMRRRFGASSTEMPMRASCSRIMIYECSCMFIDSEVFLPIPCALSALRTDVCVNSC